VNAPSNRLSVHASRVLLLLAVGLLAACAGETEADEEEEVESTEDAITSGASLDAAVKFLGTAVRRRSPGTELAISVRDLETGATEHLNGDVKHTSASSAKAIWVAAALDAVDDDRVRPFALPIFRVSDNAAAGEAIDLVGPNAVNRFYDKAGMRDSGFIQWNFGAVRESTNRPRPLGSNNYFTANDATRFLVRLEDGRLLEAASRKRMMEWMKESPNSGLGGWLGARLPAAAREGMMHKAGWLPPPLASEQTNEIGIINAEPGGNHRYAVAIFARHGDDYWKKQNPFVEFASCVIYRAVSRQTTLKCS
jgi:beta-lactamase class A